MELILHNIKKGKKSTERTITRGSTTGTMICFFQITKKDSSYCMIGTLKPPFCETIVRVGVPPLCNHWRPYSMWFMNALSVVTFSVDSYLNATSILQQYF